MNEQDFRLEWDDIQVTIWDDKGNVVVDGQVISGSLYKDKGVGLYREVQSSETELLEFVNKIVSIWTPADVFVVDIALADGVYYVLEMGNFNSAGMYHCDIQKIVVAIENMVNK